MGIELKTSPLVVWLIPRDIVSNFIIPSSPDSGKKGFVVIFAWHELHKSYVKILIGSQTTCLKTAKTFYVFP